MISGFSVPTTIGTIENVTMSYDGIGPEFSISNGDDTKVKKSENLHHLQEKGKFSASIEAALKEKSNQLDLSQQLQDNSQNCQENEFPCLDGECIKIRWRCDSYPDCNDGSDETDCSITSSTTSTSIKPNPFEFEFETSTISNNLNEGK